MTKSEVIEKIDCVQDSSEKADRLFIKSKGLVSALPEDYLESVRPDILAASCIYLTAIVSPVKGFRQKDLENILEVNTNTITKHYRKILDILEVDNTDMLLDSIEEGAKEYE